ncbi:MAG: hypothetical protein WCW68_12350 [Methanothrix sp.]
MDERLYWDQVLDKHRGKHVNIYLYKTNGEDQKVNGYLSDYSQFFIELVDRNDDYDEAFKTIYPVQLIKKISAK